MERRPYLRPILALGQRFRPQAAFVGDNDHYIYSRYKKVGSVEMDESYFPVLWRNDGYRTPWLAILIQSAWSCILALTGSYEQLANYVVFADWNLVSSIGAFGMLVAVTIKQAQTFTWIMQLVVFPTVFLSGALYPVAGLPAWLEVLNRINPLTYAVDAMRHLVFSHLDVSERARRTLDPGVTWFGWQVPPALEVAMVVLMGLGMLGLAVARFARTE